MQKRFATHKRYSSEGSESITVALNAILAEASRLGFTRAIVPASAPSKVDGMSVHKVGTLNEALAAAQLPAS